VNGNIVLSTVADLSPSSAIPTACLFPIATIISSGTVASVWIKIDLLVFISFMKLNSFIMFPISVPGLFSFLFSQPF